MLHHIELQLIRNAFIKTLVKLNERPKLYTRNGFFILYSSNITIVWISRIIRFNFPLQIKIS